MSKMYCIIITEIGLRKQNIHRKYLPTEGEYEDWETPFSKNNENSTMNTQKVGCSQWANHARHSLWAHNYEPYHGFHQLCFLESILVDSSNGHTTSFLCDVKLGERHDCRRAESLLTTPVPSSLIMITRPLRYDVRAAIYYSPAASIIICK